jgi:hypothetical protein
MGFGLNGLILNNEIPKKKNKNLTVLVGLTGKTYAGAICKYLRPANPSAPCSSRPSPRNFSSFEVSEGHTAVS